MHQTSYSSRRSRLASATCVWAVLRRTIVIKEGPCCPTALLGFGHSPPCFFPRLRCPSWPSPAVARDRRVRPDLRGLRAPREMPGDKDFRAFPVQRALVVRRDRRVHRDPRATPDRRARPDPRASGAPPALTAAPAPGTSSSRPSAAPSPGSIPMSPPRRGVPSRRFRSPASRRPPGPA